MIFLEWYKPSTWLSGVDDKIMGTVQSGIRSLIYGLDSLIYKLIINVYNIFEALCTSRLLSTDLLSELAERIGLILGLVMFFNVVFSFIKIMLNPDSMDDKDSGAFAIIKKTILVIVMLGSSNFIFNTLYDVQNIVIKSNVLNRLILPYTLSDTEDFGAVLSSQLLLSFYYVEDGLINDVTGEDKSTVEVCEQYRNALQNQIIDSNRFDIGYFCLNEAITQNHSTLNILSADNEETEGQQTYVISFDWLFSVVAGVITLYMVASYCISIGVRMIQLMFLEIISPMAIVSYLSPKKDNMFGKWGKIYFATYIDVFIRMVIINFIVFLLAAVLNTNTALEGFEFWDTIGTKLSGSSLTFVKVVIVIALLIFAKKVPELLKDLFPAGASKLGLGGVGFKDMLGGSTLQKGAKFLGGAATGVIGGIAGGATIGLLSGSPGGIVGGILKGGLSGLKGQGFKKTATGAWKSNKDAIQNMRNVRANGGNWGGYHLAKLQQGLGIRTAYERDETAMANAQRVVDTYNDAEAEAKSEAIKNRENYNMISFDGYSHSLGELEMLKADQSLTSKERENYGIEYDRLLKAATQFNLDYGAAMENGLAAFDNTGNFTDAMDYATGTVYNVNNIDSMSSTDRAQLIGDTNAKIEAGMQKLGGKAHSGRGKNNKDKRNANSTFINNTKVNDEYRKHKANAGK